MPTAADAIMIARGDLEIQPPLESVPVVQKKLIRKANPLGRPVITATQMLLSIYWIIADGKTYVSSLHQAFLFMRIKKTGNKG